MQSRITEILTKLRAAEKKAQAISLDWKDDYRRNQQAKIMAPAKREALQALEDLKHEVEGNLQEYEKSIDDALMPKPKSELEKIKQEIIESEIRKRYADWLNNIEHIKNARLIAGLQDIPNKGDVASAWLKQVKSGDALSYKAVMESKIPLFDDYTAQGAYHNLIAALAPNKAEKMKQAEEEAGQQKVNIYHAKRKVSEITKPYGA